MTETCKQAVRDKGGRFKKGHSGNPKGSNKYTSIVPLLNALDRAGEKRGEDFWDMVAKKVWMNETVLIAILKKILPDEVHTEVTGQNTLVQIIQQLAEKENGNRETDNIGNRMAVSEMPLPEKP